jgi:hypothetical protein
LTVAACGSSKNDDDGTQAPPDRIETVRAKVPSSTGTDRAARPPLLPPERVSELVRELRVDNWYGFYVAGKKVGYARVWIGPSPEGAPAPFAAGMEISIHSNDDVRTVVSRSERLHYYEEHPPYRLIERRDVEVSPDGRAVRTYIADGVNMIIRQETDGKVVGERRLPRTGETVVAMLAEFGLDATDVVPGQSLSAITFDIDEERDRETVVIVREVREQIVSGVPTRIAVLESQNEGDNVVTEITVASRGVVLLATIGDSMRVVLEEKEVAQSDVEGFGVFSDAVPVDRKLGDPSSIDSLDLVVSVPAGYELPSTPSQRVTRREDGKLDVALRSIPGDLVTAEERLRATSITSSIDADNADVVAVAKRVVGDATTARAKVDAIVKWIYRDLDKSLSTNLTVASQVLDKKIGDCTEHTILFVAMARAVGVPAREVSGLIYMGDRHQTFGWHAWAEVEIDGRWVGVDAAWDETIASAAHILLGVEYSSDWVSVMGGITLSAP